MVEGHSTVDGRPLHRWWKVTPQMVDGHSTDGGRPLHRWWKATPQLLGGHFIAVFFGLDEVALYLKTAQ